MSSTNSYVLFADTVSGVVKYDLIDFLVDYPDWAFESSTMFELSLGDMVEGEEMACIVDPMVHKEMIERINEAFGIY